MNALALLLLLTVGSLEQSYGPYARPWRGGSHSLAAARSGSLLAWSENDATGHARVHVVLLDSKGRAISPVAIIPALTPSRDALVPSVATDGTSFLVVWEEALGVQRTVGITVDSGGRPIGEPRPIGHDVTIKSVDYEPARVHWTGTAYVVHASNGYGVRIDAGGAVLGLVAGRVPEATASNGTSGSLFIWNFPVANNIGRPGNGSPPRSWNWHITWMAGSESKLESLPTDVEPFSASMTAAGTYFVLTFLTESYVYYRATHAQRYATDVNVDRSSRLRTACAETRCVLVFSTRTGDVEGIVIDHTRPELPPVRFTAAATGRMEREPEVVMITDSRALVTWRSSGTDGERLVGRTLQLATPKQRAVR
jgi:hypothetical protein